jgi:hypothetical protein
MNEHMRRPSGSIDRRRAIESGRKPFIVWLDNHASASLGLRAAGARLAGGLAHLMATRTLGKFALGSGVAFDADRGLARLGRAQRGFRFAPRQSRSNREMPRGGDADRQARSLLCGGEAISPETVG